MTFDELTTPLTRAEVEAKIYAALAARGVSTTTWKTGAVVRTIIVGLAIVVSSLSRLQAIIAKSGFLEESEGDWLTLVARYVYDVERDLGTFASGTLTLTNTGGNVYSGVAGDLIALNPTTLKTYRNTASYSIGAGSPGTPTVVSVAFEAVELGSDSTSTPGSITELETALLGVAVTNAAALVGTDKESDPALRARCAAKLGSLSPDGPKDAYSFVATSTKRADGEAIGVTRVRTIADGSGNVTVYVADADGEVTSPDVALIQAAIEADVEPLAVTATVESAAPKAITVTYELWLRDTSALTDAQIGEAIEARITEYLSAQPIGGQVLVSGDPGRVYVSALETVIGAAIRDEVGNDLCVVKVAVTVPAADVDLAVDEAPVFAGATALGIHQVSGGLI